MLLHHKTKISQRYATPALTNIGEWGLMPHFAQPCCRLLTISMASLPERCSTSRHNTAMRRSPFASSSVRPASSPGLYLCGMQPFGVGIHNADSSEGNHASEIGGELARTHGIGRNDAERSLVATANSAAAKPPAPERKKAAPPRGHGFLVRACGPVFILLRELPLQEPRRQELRLREPRPFCHASGGSFWPCLRLRCP